MHKGSGFGGARGAGLPIIVNRYMERKINIDNPASRTMRVDKINDVLELTREDASVHSVLVI
jgi:S-(hydroxymethyl)glutathione dehydrogenase / alcohol dehydrogenase